MKGPCGRRSRWQMDSLSASAVSRLGFVLLSPGEDRGSLLASGFLFVGATKENICGM